jgi:hypothetical protein
LSNAAEPVDDDIVYSPDDEAVLVGWVLHSIIRVMYSRRRRGDKQKLCEGVIRLARQLHLPFPSSIARLTTDQARAERLQRATQQRAEFLRSHAAVTYTSNHASSTTTTTSTDSSTAALVFIHTRATTADTAAATTTTTTTTTTPTAASTTTSVQLDLDSPGMRFFRNLNQGGLKLPVHGLLELAARMHTVWARCVLQKKKTTTSFKQAHIDITSDAKVEACYRTLCAEQVPPPTEEVQVLFLSKFISKWTHVRQSEFCTQLTEEASAQNQNIALRAMVLMSRKRRVPPKENPSSSMTEDALDAATADAGMIVDDISDSGSSSELEDQPQFSVADMLALDTANREEDEDDSQLG